MTRGPATTGFKTSNLHWALCSCRLHKCTHMPSITVQPVCWTGHRLFTLRDVDQFVWQFHNAAGLWRGSLSCSTLLIQHTCATDADRQRSPCARCCTAATLCGYPDKHSQLATNMSVRTCTVPCFVSAGCPSLRCHCHNAGRNSKQSTSSRGQGNEECGHPHQPVSIPHSLQVGKCGLSGCGGVLRTHRTNLAGHCDLVTHQGSLH